MTAITFLQDQNGKQPPLPIEDLSQHHLLVVGQTGSGKTTTTLSWLNNLRQTKTATIVLDPTGEYSQLSSSQHYIFGDNCYLDAGAWNAETLLTTLDVEHNPFETALVDRAIQSLRIENNLYQVNGVYRKLGRSTEKWSGDLGRLQSWAQSYPVTLLPDQIVEELVVPFADQRADYQLLGQQYDTAAINREWQFIANLRSRLRDQAFQNLFDTVAHPGKVCYELSFVLKLFLTKRSDKTLVIDLSHLRESGRSQRTLLSLIFNKMLVIRTQEQSPVNFPVNIVIDEAHRYLPIEQQQLADNGIFRLLREGRKAGLSLTMTTQSTLDLPDRLRSQFANVLVHHLASVDELAYLHLTDLPTTSLKTGQCFLIQAGQQPQQWQVQLPQ